MKNEDKDKGTPDLNERCYPELNSKRVVQDHLSAYEFAAEFVKDEIVLDIACGEGYGSDILKKAGAKEVYGVDVDWYIVEKARKKYPGIRFSQGNAIKTKFSDNKFGVIVSYQTWHHLDGYHNFIPEIHRILKPGGIFLCSVPNRKALYLSPFNREFLTKYYKVDFDKEKVELHLKNYFRVEQWYGQRIVKNFLINPFVKTGLWLASKLNAKLRQRIRKAYTLGRGPEIYPLTGENARYLLFVGRKI